MNKIKKLLVIIFSSLAFMLAAHAQVNQNETRTTKKFKELLARVSASFIMPDGFVEVPPVNNEKTAYQYALQLPNAAFEVRFQVNTTSHDWKIYERQHGAEKINPDSLYSRIADAQVNSFAADANRISRPFSPRVLQYYNADIGRSYFFSLADSPLTRHYQYALLVVVQKNHLGSVAVLCMSNDRGPEFFKNINMLRNCLKFNP